MIDITLAKEKYRTQKQPYKCGAYRSRTGNSHGGNKPKGRQGTGHRRRQGLGAVGQ
jgi:hypothetical protein